MNKNKTNKKYILGFGILDSLKNRMFSGYQNALNSYINKTCGNRSRKLEFGELHVPCHNFSGPGTRMDLYADIEPYNNIDACSKTHDLAYGDIQKKNISKQEKALLVHKADQDALNCYDKYQDEWGYLPSKLGIQAKADLEQYYSNLKGEPVTFYGTSKNNKNNKFIDKDIYNFVKKEADKVYKKPSAYKSGYIVKLYKRLGGRFKGDKQKKKGLSRWFAEDWTNQRGQKGYKYKSDIYRPRKIISDETPKTYDELTESQIKRARKKKAETGRVDKF